jgi:hypothetical protein
MKIQELINMLQAELDRGMVDVLFDYGTMVGESLYCMSTVVDIGEPTDEDIRFNEVTPLKTITLVLD